MPTEWLHSLLGLQLTAQQRAILCQEMFKDTSLAASTATAALTCTVGPMVQHLQGKADVIRAAGRDGWL